MNGSRRVRDTVALLAGLAVVAVIIWLDVASGIWQDLVVLSGLAAGLVTFLLTVLVLDRVVARSTARRWAPVNRLAFSEFLHDLADDEHSEISRGRIVTRALPTLSTTPSSPDYADDLHLLRESIVDERARLADSLSRWAPFLASSGDNAAILLHLADIALALDTVRDAALQAEESLTAADHDLVMHEIDACNDRLGALAAELVSRLATPERPRRSLART